MFISAWTLVAAGVTARSADALLPNLFASMQQMNNGAKKFPSVKAPPNFVPPEPRPLTVTGDVGSLLSVSVALGLRLGTGALVMGWSPSVSLAQPSEAGAYALQLGPFFITDQSAVLRGEYA